MDVSSGTIFLKQKEEDWQRMLAQGQSFHPPTKKKERRPNYLITNIRNGRGYITTDHIALKG